MSRRDKRPGTGHGGAPARPLSLLAFLPDLTRGGAQRSVVNVLNSLDPKIARAALAVPSADGAARAWLDDDIELIDFGRTRVRRTIADLRRLVRARRPDLLFASMVDANIVAALATATMGPPPRLILRETNSHRARGDLGAARRFLIGRAYRRADRVVALSHGVRDELIEDYRLDPTRITTIHNPVDVAGFARRAERARKAEAPWGQWAGGHPVILGVGRLVRQKGFDRLLEAVASMDGEARVVLVGEGAEEVALRHRAAELGIGERVLMPGAVDCPAAWMAHADLFVLSSRWEGFGHVIVEAMASGCPVLATDCPHGPRDIIRDGVDGVLLPAGDADTIARATAALLEDTELRARLSIAGRTTAARFDRALIGGQYAELFLDAVGA